MASACNFVGILGLDDGIQFMPADKRHYWKHDAYIPMPSGDFPAEMFIYGGPESTAVDKGIYFVAARALLAPSANVHEDDASLQLYANCEPQRLPTGSRAFGVFVLCGKVTRSTTDLERHLGFDLDIVQWAAVAQQTIRITCYYPTSHRRLSKTPMPAVGKHVTVQGVLQRIDGDRCAIAIQDITFGPAELTGPTTDSPPSSKLKQFDWYAKGKGKRARYEGDGDDSAPVPSTSSSQTAE